MGTIYSYRTFSRISSGRLLMPIVSTKELQWGSWSSIGCNWRWPGKGCVRMGGRLVGKVWLIQSHCLWCWVFVGLVIRYLFGEMRDACVWRSKALPTKLSWSCWAALKLLFRRWLPLIHVMEAHVQMNYQFIISYSAAWTGNRGSLHFHQWLGLYATELKYTCWKSHW